MLVENHGTFFLGLTDLTLIGANLSIASQRVLLYRYTVSFTDSDFRYALVKPLTMWYLKFVKFMSLIFLNDMVVLLSLGSDVVMSKVTR